MVATSLETEGPETTTKSSINKVSNKKNRGVEQTKAVVEEVVVAEDETVVVAVVVVVMSIIRKEE